MRSRDSRGRRLDVMQSAWMTGDLKPTARNISGAGLIEAQPGWFWCNGAALSRAQYERLFSEIGTDYGPGDGSTTFNLPDYRGRGFMFALGGATGANRVTAATLRGVALGTESEILGLSQIPAHDHGGVTGIQSANHIHTDAGHVHPTSDPQHRHLQDPLTMYAFGGPRSGSDDIGNPSIPPDRYTGFALTGVSVGAGFASIGVQSVNHTHPISIAGGGGSHNNVQPSLVAGGVLIRY